MNVVDFARHADAVAARINSWVEERTRGKIRDLIPPGSLNALTRLVLVNAVYFKGKWVDQFPQRLTDPTPFHRAGRDQVAVPMMYQQNRVRYMEAKGLQALNLDYRGCDLSMLVLLPERKDGLPELEKALTARMLHDCAARLTTREVEVFLPRFKITWGSVDVKGELADLGMPLAFDDARADFSGTNGTAPPREDSLFLSNVFHKAFVEVNEEGTEAAAATGVVMMGRSLGAEPPKPRIPIFRADHPFLFAIRDRISGTILFLGRSEDPTREE